MVMSHVLALMENVQLFLEGFPRGEDRPVLEERSVRPLVYDAPFLEKGHCKCHFQGEYL